MKILIAGGTGFLGKHLESFFQNKNHTVKILTRKPLKTNQILWDAKNLGDWTQELENCDVLINLTGKSVDCRYTSNNKREILDSRIQSTAILQQAVQLCKKPPKIWINASSATIYIHAEKHQHSESNGIAGDDFSMNICKSWEQEFLKVTDPEIRKVALRTSIVLGKKGGAFPKFLQVTKLGLGGKQGSGNQWMSWIHIDDFCEAVNFIIENQSIEGPVNITAPVPVSNHDFMKILRRKIGAPFGLPSPVWLLELAAVLLKTETELLLKSRNVYPEMLLKKGFRFRYPEAESALDSLI